MDPIASGLTIFRAIKEGLNVAKGLYDAPQELRDLQAEIETFGLILNHVSLHVLDLRNEQSVISHAVRAAQSCLLDIQRLIEFELLKDVPGEKKARRIAWICKAERVQELLEKLSERRANVVLVLNHRNL